MESLTVANPADVEAALLHAELVPPAAPDSLRPGATADLRNLMARFSSGDEHGLRRLAVEMAVAALGEHRFVHEAQRRTTAVLGEGGPSRVVDAIAEIGYVVPVDTVASALGVAESDLHSVRAEVSSIVAVIGRGDPSSGASDEAAASLLYRFAALGHDPVAVVSLLYQSHDACCAMFASILVADQTGQRRRTALVATKRTATTDLTVGSNRLMLGTTVVIDLESPRLEFGLGAHRCPGQELAERIVIGMVEAVRTAGVGVAIDDAEWREDGRAQVLPLR